jgi:hypothetical protein
VRTNYGVLVTAYVVGVLLSFSADSVEVIVDVQVLGLVHDVGNPCGLLSSLWGFLDGLWQNLGWDMSLLAMCG